MGAKKVVTSTNKGKKRFRQFHYRADAKSVKMQQAILEYIREQVKSSTPGDIETTTGVPSQSDAIRYAIRYTWYQKIGRKLKQQRKEKEAST